MWLALILFALLAGCGSSVDKATAPTPASEPTQMFSGVCPSDREKAGMVFEYERRNFIDARDEFCGPELISTWFTNRSEDVLTGEKSLAAFTDATSHDVDFTYIGSTPSLGIECEGRSLRLGVWFAGEPLPSGYMDIMVLYRFDDNDPVEEAWDGEPEKEFAILPGERGHSFMEGLRTSNKLILRAWNYRGRELGTLTFDLAGFELDAEPVLQECGY